MSTQNAKQQSGYCEYNSTVFVDKLYMALNTHLSVTPGNKWGNRKEVLLLFWKVN
jgi:hypothetical protein